MRKILITGGTGLVGGAICERLDDAALVSLSRNAGEDTRSSQSAASAFGMGYGHVGRAVEAAEVEGLVHVRGDVTQPLLGMETKDYEALAEEIDLVIHCAGVTDFTTHRKITSRLHVDGTRNIVELAERAGAPLFHISTAYVEAEGTSVRGRWGAEIYINTKREAEGIVSESDALQAIVRPSIVWGNTADGWTPSFQGLHRLIGMMLENKLPLLPFGPETCVDFLPRDVVGRVTAQLVNEDFSGEYWLSAGPRALGFGRIVELLLEFGRGMGYDLQPPRFVTTEMIDRLIRPAAGETMVRRVDLMLALTSHFASEPELRSDVPPGEVPDLEQALLRGAEYWAQENGIENKEPEVIA